MVKNKQGRLVVFITLLIVTAVLVFFIQNKPSLSAPIFYVANAGDGTISEINLLNNTPVKTVELGVEQLSHGIAISPDETTVYFGTGFQGKSLHAIDITTNKILNEKSFEEGIHGIDIHPSGKYLYVSLMAGLGQEGGELAVIDTTNFEVIALITTDDGPAHVSVSADGSHIWVANVNGNSVSAVDAYTFQVLATIPVGEVPNEVALSPKLDYAFVANVRSNSLTVIGMQTFDIITELEVGEGVHGVTVSPDGKQAWTANNYSSDVTVVDIATLSIVTKIETGSFANHISFSPDGNLAFVTQREANNLVVIDTKNYHVLKELELGKEPHEMTLKGMEVNTNNDIKTTSEVNFQMLSQTSLLLEREAFAEGVEVKVQLLSPFNEEESLFVISNVDIDPFNYFALKVEMTTHSGDLTSVPFAERTFLTNQEGVEIKADKWVIVNNDSHHPQFLALFEKTVNTLPILKGNDTVLSVNFRPFIINEDLVINLHD